MSAQNICMHFKYRYYKYCQCCRKQHIETNCQNSECETRKCLKRHPREYTYYNIYSRCKFGVDCLFDHIDRVDPVLQELQELKENVL